MVRGPACVHRVQRRGQTRVQPSDTESGCNRRRPVHMLHPERAQPTAKAPQPHCQRYVFHVFHGMSCSFVLLLPNTCSSSLQGSRRQRNFCRDSDSILMLFSLLMLTGVADTICAFNMSVIHTLQVIHSSISS